jgi:Ca2+-binding RTX toxin-like protein
VVDGTCDGAQWGLANDQVKPGGGIVTQGGLIADTSVYGALTEAPVRFEFTIQNTSGASITMQTVIVAVRPPTGMDPDNNEDVACPGGQNLTLAPQQTFTCSVSRSFPWIGTYSYYAAWLDTGSQWHTDLWAQQTFGLDYGCPAWPLTPYVDMIASRNWHGNCPLYLADVDGDGRQEAVGFSYDGVVVDEPLDTVGGSFWASRRFSYFDGPWSTYKNLRLLGDVDGDGKDDVIGIGDSQVIVARSTGSAFGASEVWLDNAFTPAWGWAVGVHPRMTGDFNGDGKTDLIGFSSSGVTVGLSTGSAFTTSTWLSGTMSYGQGWRIDMHPRLVGDVNGDGKDDVVGIASSTIILALSTGSSFTSIDTGLSNFTYNGSWRVDRHPRFLADVNGDGKDDIVGFGEAAVVVALSTGSGFSTPSNWSAEFVVADGYEGNFTHPRFLADVNRDGRADIIGFGPDGMEVAYSSGSSFGSPILIRASYTLQQGGWSSARHPRLIGDITGDGSADLVAYSNAWRLTHILDQCGGSFATLWGTTGNDSLVGTSGRDVILGLGGKDTLTGLGGDDLLCGGAGADTIWGGDGNDRLYGGLGRDRLEGEGGNDRLFGQGGNDTLTGGLGTDTASGGPGTDTCVAEKKGTCEG